MNHMCADFFSSQSLKFRINDSYQVLTFSGVYFNFRKQDCQHFLTNFVTDQNKIWYEVKQQGQLNPSRLIYVIDIVFKVKYMDKNL